MTGMRKCIVCGSLFSPRQSHQKYCGFNCKVKAGKTRAKLWRKKPPWKPKEIRCKFCFEKFIPANPWQKYHPGCSKKKKASGKLKTVECEFCHQTFFSTNASQKYHPACKECLVQLNHLFRYFQICRKCRDGLKKHFSKQKKTPVNNEKSLKLFFSYKSWCAGCRNKINNNRKQKKPNKAEKNIYSYLRKQFPRDEIVLLDRRQLRYQDCWWRIDVYNRTKKFGFEYDEPEDESGFLVERKVIKNKLCEAKNIRLIRINWKEILTEELIALKLKENNL